MRELAFLEGHLQKVAGHHRQAVKDALGGGVRLGQSEANCVLIYFLYCNRFSADDKKIALRRMQFLVEINCEGEHHVVGVEGLTIRKAQAMAQVHREHSPILGDSPGLGQGGFGLLRCAVDVDQIGGQPADHLSRRRVRGSCRIQCFWLATLADCQNTAVMSNFVVGDLEFFAALRRLRCGRREAASTDEQEEGDTTQTRHSYNPQARLLD